MENVYENRPIKNIYCSRFIASWLNGGGRLDSGAWRRQFRIWLESLTIDGKPLTTEDVADLMFLATNGKMELEKSVKIFIDKNIPVR